MERNGGRGSPLQEETHLNNKKFVTVGIWLLLALAIVWMASGFEVGGKKAEELDYNTEFLALVKHTESGEAGEKTIAAIQIEYRDVYGLYTGSTAKADPFGNDVSGGHGRDCIRGAPRSVSKRRRGIEQRLYLCV